MNVLVERLSVAFQTAQDEPLAALGPVSFTVASGSFVALLGPSGSGKSTLIRVIAGLQKASSGGVWLDDWPQTSPSRQVGIMFQDANLMPWRTVLENIALPLQLAGVPKEERLSQARDLLPLLGLEDFAESYPGELSGGMAQRAALGRVLVHHPDLLLLDEPFGALDALTREQVSLDLLRVRERYGQTVMMVTHDINEAVLLADRVMVLSRRPGQLIGDVSVGLPRPRHAEMIYSADFIDTARYIRQLIDRA